MFNCVRVTLITPRVFKKRLIKKSTKQIRKLLEINNFISDFPEILLKKRISTCIYIRIYIVHS